MDQTTDPCDDFFQYACGTWNKKHVIPEDRSSISTFEVMNDQLDLILRGELIGYRYYFSHQSTPIFFIVNQELFFINLLLRKIFIL